MSSTSEQFEEKPSQEQIEEIDEAREKRLDPENRPDNAEVDNTDRTFDSARGEYTDSEDYDPDEPAPFSDPEDPNNPDSSVAKNRAASSEED